MNNKVSMKDVFQILSTDFHNEKVSTADGVLTFHNELGPKIHKLILDDGYEDPLVIEFAPKVRVCIPLDSFGVGDRSATSASVAKNIATLLNSLLNNQYELSKTTFLSTSLYEISIEGGRKFEGEPSSFLPRSIIRAMGTKVKIGYNFKSADSLLEKHARELQKISYDVLLSIAKSSEPITYTFKDEYGEHQIEVFFDAYSKERLVMVVAIDSDWNARFAKRTNSKVYEITPKDYDSSQGSR